VAAAQEPTIGVLLRGSVAASEARWVENALTGNDAAAAYRYEYTTVGSGAGLRVRTTITEGAFDADGNFLPTNVQNVVTLPVDAAVTKAYTDLQASLKNRLQSLAQ
jgi:hypothetical protein